MQIFSMTQTADLALKLASEESGLGSSLVGHEDGGTVRDYISFLTLSHKVHRVMVSMTIQPGLMRWPIAGKRY